MQKIRVLLAEDHQTIREGLKLIINNQPDMEVVGECADGVAAVDLAQLLVPDVVVMDISMPGMNGLKATQQLRECCPQAKVLPLTRHAEEGYLRQMLQAGASGYVLKQSHSSELLSGIRTVAAGGRYLDPAMATRLLRDLERSNRPTTRPASATLSAREEEVLRLIARGYSNKEIADQLRLSVKTVETHKANSMHKLGMQSRIDVVRFAIISGWMSET